MARRPLPVEPMSRMALWARRLALFALTASVLATVIVRSGMLELVPAVAAFGGALVVALVAVVLALGGFVAIWRTGQRGLGNAVLAFALGLALLAYPAYLGVVAYRLPRIFDITTDAADPPRFETLARVRPRDANPVEYPGARTAALQASFYPDVEPYLAATTPEAVYDVALTVINRHRWRIVDERPPRPGRPEGHIEAVARTAIMGLREDLALRIRPVEGGARLDIRSASRYGPLDFGSNAARIRLLTDEIDDALSAQPRPAPVEAKAAPPTAPARRQPDRR